MIRVRHVVSAVAACIVAAGCSSTAPSEIELGVEFTLAPNQTVRISGTGLTLGFRRVIGDSRCPVDILCASEGSAGIELDVFGAAQSGPIVLQSRIGLDRWDDGEYQVQMVSLQPAPSADRQIPPADYRARLMVTLLDAS